MHNNNHMDRSMLTNMVEILKARTQPTTFYKVKAHVNIKGNEQGDKLAKLGPKKTTPLLQNHMNSHIPHHSVSKRAYGHDPYNGHTKAMSNVSKHI